MLCNTRRAISHADPVGHHHPAVERRERVLKACQHRKLGVLEELETRCADVGIRVRLVPTCLLGEGGTQTRRNTAKIAGMLSGQHRTNARVCIQCVERAKRAAVARHTVEPTVTATTCKT